MGLSRSATYERDEIGTYHCYSRCVRRGFLCGDDPVTGNNYDHRKEWIEELVKLGAIAFVIDVIAFSILDNHFHLVLRNRPDRRAALSPTAIARRWLMIFPNRRDKDGRPCKPKSREIREIVRNKARVEELRRRLGDISWFMRVVKERVARRANQEDGVKGTFFEKRFEMKRLLTEEAVLACAVYVDLNLIRAGMAETPETSVHTSAFLRIQGMRDRAAGKKQHASDRWLARLNDPALLTKSQRDQKKSLPLSERPGLGVSPEEYLNLLDKSGREARPGKAGKIPDGLAPILDRLGFQRPSWSELITSFRDLFRRVAGRPAVVEQFAANAKQHWMQGIRNCRRLFG